MYSTGILNREQAKEMLESINESYRIDEWEANITEDGMVQFDRSQEYQETWAEGQGGIVNESHDGLYNNCQMCYDYSMLFGGSHKGRDITSEEEFEQVKQEFVAHFNKYHKDEFMQRGEKKKRTYKKVKEKDPDEGREFPPANDVATTNTTALHGRGIIDSIFNNPNNRDTWLARQEIIRRVEDGFNNSEEND
jgi:hypothetical protein